MHNRIILVIISIVPALALNLPQLPLPDSPPPPPPLLPSSHTYIDDKIIKKNNIQYGKQESRTTSHYECDEMSYFKTISRQELETHDLIECNAVYQSPVNYTAVGTARVDANGHKIQLKVIDSHFALRDVNGTELYSNVGVVVNEPCLGAIIYIYGFGTVSRGSCTSRSGVTEVSVTRDGLFSIRGTCDSTCWGSVRTVYTPGKHYYDNDKFTMAGHKAGMAFDKECKYCDIIE